MALKDILTGVALAITVTSTAVAEEAPKSTRDAVAECAIKKFKEASDQLNLKSPTEKMQAFITMGKEGINKIIIDECKKEVESVRDTAPKFNI